MGRIWIQLSVLLLALAAIVAAGVLPLLRTQIFVPQPVAVPSDSQEPATVQPLSAGCLRDPAGLPPPPADPEGSPSNYLHGCGSRLYDSEGHAVKIAGLNWSGMETGDYVPGGLGARRWQEILDQVAALGYNTIRIPFSNEALEPGKKVNNVDSTLNPDLRDRSPLEVLDLLIQGARDRGLKVILDRHWATPASRDSLWYGPNAMEERWIADWRMLAARYSGNDTVIGVDLSNEPRNPATWGSGDLATDWRLAAERAGDAILEVNPYLLILVEGIESYQGDRYWWGGNLQGVDAAPVRLSVPNRVVYSPHDYGPNVSGQYWFDEPGFPGNLPLVWDAHWGYIQRQGIAPVVVGEFGGRSVGADREGQWQRALLSYLRANEVGALVWALYPGWDTGGVLEPDGRTVDIQKHREYSQILAPPLALGASGVFGRAPDRVRAVVRENSGGGDSLLFSFEIANDGPDSLALNRLELRYQIRVGDKLDPARPPAIEAVEPLGGNLRVEIVEGGNGGAEGYLRVRFTPAAGSLPRYERTAPITIRMPRNSPGDSSAQLSSGVNGVGQVPDGLPEPRDIGLYRDGELEWGR